MPLINLVVLLVIVGFGLWLINKYIPMAPPIKTILNVLVIIIVVVILLQIIGVWGSLSTYRIGR